MKNLVINTALALTLSLLTGCFATPLQRSQLTMVKKGSTISDIQKYVANSDLDNKFEFSSDDKEYLVQVYALQTGTNQSMTMVCTPTCMPISTTVAVTAPYVFIFEKSTEQLTSWGLIEELSKSPDQNTSKLMPPLKLALEATKKKHMKTNKGQ